VRPMRKWGLAESDDLALGAAVVEHTVKRAMGGRAVGRKGLADRAATGGRRPRVFCGGSAAGGGGSATGRGHRDRRPTLEGRTATLCRISSSVSITVPDRSTGGFVWPGPGGWGHDALRPG